MRAAARRSRMPFRASVAAATPAALAKAAVSVPAGLAGTYMAGSGARATPAPSGVASSQGGRVEEADLAGGEPACQGCQSSDAPACPLAGPVGSAHGAAGACCAPSASRAGSPAAHSSCSHGGRSAPGVATGGDPFPLAAVVTAASAAGAADSSAAGSGGSQPGTGSPA